MECHCIPQSQLPHTTRLFQDYLEQFPNVSPFYSYSPHDPASFLSAAGKIDYPATRRQAVVSILREQNKGFGASSATFASLDRLENSDSVAIVTGQQVGLFSGPAFGLYKALSTALLARELTSHGLDAVPVFWLATEDHDLEEISHCTIQDRDGQPRKLVYGNPSVLADAPVGTVRLGDAIQPVLEQLSGLLPESDAASELLRMVRDCYRPEATLGSAFGALLARLFSDFGVILLDPYDARLHEMSAGVFRAALESAPELAQDLMLRDQQLSGAGYHAQVHVTENTCLLFLIENGQRTGLRWQDGRFVSSRGESFQPEQLSQRLKAHPESFSPNVLLRPVMQDLLLPTAAYVGGPSEVAYMAQASVVYQRILRRMPVIVPRASGTILDPASNRLFGKYELSFPDVFSGGQELREKLAARLLPADLAARFEKAEAHLQEDIKQIRQSLSRLDPTLVDAASNSGQKMQYQLSHLEKKAFAALQKRSDQIERDAMRLENNLFPGKHLQERLYGGMNFLARYGPSFLQALSEKLPVHSTGHHLLIP